ncbi:unnamed protein product [Rotaria sp. Silwood1]|nr:unnamed protein product [Rotaria sp. Silwood1]
MTINNIRQQRSSSYQIDNLDTKQTHTQNTNDSVNNSINNFKNKILTGIHDENYHWLFENSKSVLDDIFSHPLLIDYFNVYLSLPIFGQRVLCHRLTHQFDFDPPILTSEQIYEEAKEWLIHCRLDNYIHTDIYIESLLILLLTTTDDSIELSSTLHTFIQSKETTIKEQSHIFSTVADVRQFHQFLQTTSGIKYWNFFIDSMRLLQSRYSSRSTRIDISYLNFIYKYYSQYHEFHSITNSFGDTRMPDSSTPDSIWFQMAINAMHQLRIYWLPRYLSQLFSSSQLKKKPSTIETNSKPIENIIKTSSDNVIVTPNNHLSTIDSKRKKEPNLVKYTLDNISYLDYYPQQYIQIQSSEQDDFQQSFEELSERNDNNQIDTNSKLKFEVPLYSSSDRSIEDYATNVNLELFYRILVSDSLAGSPFLQYISQIVPKTDVISFQTCIHCITDAEIVLSIPSEKFKERILKQFISRYIEVTATAVLPNQILDNIDEQRHELIKELINNNNNNSQYPLLWKILLKITKFLIPHFLHYIKFDRLRCLIKGKTLNINLIINDLHHILPSVNFDKLLTDQQNIKETILKQTYSTEREIFLKNYLTTCNEQQKDLIKLFIQNQYYTTEKQINTDEQCEFRIGERFPPLTDHELEQELRRFCTKFEQKNIETILGKSFDAPIISHQTNISTFIGDPLSHNTTNQTLLSNEYLELNTIDTFTLEIINSAREIYEIDRFISNIMNESINLIQNYPLIKSIKSDSTSSSLSSISDDILITNSSSILTYPEVITNNINQNAFVSLNSSETNFIMSKKINEKKILSLIGSYFINSSNITNDNLISQIEYTIINNNLDPIINNYLKENHLKSLNEFSLHQNFESFSPSFHNSIKKLIINHTGIGQLSIDLTKTNILSNKHDILKNNNKIKLYTINHIEFLLANIKSYNFDNDKQELHLYLDNFKLPDITKFSIINNKNINKQAEFFHETIKFTHEDKCNEIKNFIIEKKISYFQNNEQQQLIEFIQNNINNHQWPLHEYIGIQGQRSWRALKLASDISNFDNGFMLNYHKDFDWISIDNNYGSFDQRTYLIIRNFQQRIEKIKTIHT